MTIHSPTTCNRVRLVTSSRRPRAPPRSATRCGAAATTCSALSSTSSSCRSRNALIVVQGHDDPRLYASRIETSAMHWIAGWPPATVKPLSAMTRYRMKPAPCRIGVEDGRRWQVDFLEPQWAPTSGQYVVVYDEDVCLGGGVIERSLTPVTTGTTHLVTV